MQRLVVTGCGGLIGSEVVSYFSKIGWEVIGIDNNMRADFFGPTGDTKWNIKRLEDDHEYFKCYNIDIKRECNNFLKQCTTDSYIIRDYFFNAFFLFQSYDLFYFNDTI